MFHSLAIAEHFMEKTKTFQGLKVAVDMLTGVYVTGKKCAAHFLETMSILFDDFLPRWNYRAVPQANLYREVIFSQILNPSRGYQRQLDHQQG